MEIFKFNIRPQAEIIQREEFKEALTSCENCGEKVSVFHHVLKECNLMREECSCANCGHKSQQDHRIQ